MKKLILGVFTFLTIFTCSVKAVMALSFEAGSSAVPKFKLESRIDFDYRVFTLRKFFSQFNSPLSPYSSDFIKMADYYNVDWRMVPAISGVESTFGKFIPKNSFNAYGWAKGNYNFKSWPDSIKIVNMTLRNNYLNRGALSIFQISHIYAPPSTTWGRNVKYFVNKITPLPLSFDI